MGVPIPVAAIIGSAVSTAVNGGTFASFAIGVGIGIAAGYISNAMGVSLLGKTNWEPFIKDPIGMFAAGALQGSIAGAISSAVYGQNIWKGMGYGALSGLTGAAVAIATKAAISFGASVIEELADMGPLLNLSQKGRITYKVDFKDKKYYLKAKSFKDIEDLWIQLKENGKKITFFEFVGHSLSADPGGVALYIGKDMFGTGDNDLSERYYGIEDYKDLVKEVFHPKAVIELEACETAYDHASVGTAFKNVLPSATVRGWTGKCKQFYPGIWDTRRTVDDLFSSKFIEVK